MLLREYEAFCEVRVLTYCIMSNHFHLLIEVPRRPVVLPTLEEMLEKLSQLSGRQDVAALRQRFANLDASKNSQARDQALARLHARLWDISFFVKLVKQRFSYLGNANYSSPQCQLEITSGPAWVWVDVVGLFRPLRRNGVPGAVGDRNAVEPKGAGRRLQPPPFSLSRFARRLSPLNSRMIE